MAGSGLETLPALSVLPALPEPIDDVAGFPRRQSEDVVRGENAARTAAE